MNFFWHNILMDKIEDTIIEFIKQYPEIFVSKKKKSNKPDPNTAEGELEIRQKIKESLNKITKPSIPSTIPDPLVSVILNEFYDIAEDDLDSVAKEHQFSMAAEDAIGDYLEDYIFSVAKDYEWCHCVGEIIRATDFLKKEKNGWSLYQIKNRSNSENSSSKRVRKEIKKETGLDITHWFRTFHRTGKTNWENFPDEDLRDKLSEKGFQTYVKDSLSALK